MSIWTATCCWSRTRGPVSSWSMASSFPRTSPGSVSEKRYLILAEGRSGDPHYGKTARGTLRSPPDPPVATLDSPRGGEIYGGVRVVAPVEGGLQYAPTPAVVGVAPQGGRFPP